MSKSSKKKQITETALSLIYDKGYQATTMRIIAEKMGFDVANLYNYIDNKQSLLDQSLLGISEEFHNGILCIDATQASVSIKLRQIVALYVNIASAHPYKTSLLIHEWRNLSPPALEIFTSQKQTVEQKISSIISGLYLDESSDDEHMIWTVHHVLSSLRWVFSYFVRKQDEPINKYALENHIYNVIWNGIKT